MITVNATVLERRDSTESWNYSNPILPNGQLGWERSIYGDPVGVKMGDGLTAWDALPYWFTTGSGGGGSRIVLLPGNALITQNLGAGTLSVAWGLALFTVFGNIEASFKVLTADGSDYVRAPYLERFTYTGTQVTTIEYVGFFDTDFKIIITI